MKFQALIRELGGRLGLPSLPLEADGRVQITFGTSVVDIEPIPDQEGYVLAGRVGSLVAADDAALLRDLLELNLLGRLSTDTFFAIEPASSQVVVCSRREGDVDYRAFEGHLETFLDALDRAKDRLRATGRQGGPSFLTEGTSLRV